MSEQILVVEDDHGVRTTIVTFLELEGFAVEAVSNTKDAIERLSQNGFPLIISDIYIDDRTGIDVLMAAKKQDPNWHHGNRDGRHAQRSVRLSGQTLRAGHAAAGRQARHRVAATG
jgi:CheY-like chemotaxis protein